MAQRRPIDTGTIGNDGTGDSIREAFRKVNDNFRDLYAAFGIDGQLSFQGLIDTPATYVGNENSLVSINPTASGLSYKTLTEGPGIKFDISDNDITVSSLFASIAGDTAPNLGGPLNVAAGGVRQPIGNMVDIANRDELEDALSRLSLAHAVFPVSEQPSRLASNKGYTDTKIALAGVETIDSATGRPDSRFGQMTGPLVLSRDPLPSDDDRWDGRVAATKRYVDSAGFGSAVNLYVSTSGQDSRLSLTDELQGRALSFAYRTLEAALMRAEELVLSAPIEIGPYKKVLTYTVPGTPSTIEQCTLTNIEAAPGAGSGFVGAVIMSVDTVSLVNGGDLYQVGDMLIVPSAIGSDIFAEIEVVAVNPVPGQSGRGPAVNFKIVNAGRYTVLPSIDEAGGTATAPVEFGPSLVASGALLRLTYRVNSIVVSAGGSDYGLVSVRLLGSNGTGAFGRADVVDGSINSITVTDPGKGFTELPTLTVDLPRFLIDTGGHGTDFTGDVTSNTAAAARTRDLREGLLLRGETSGALAQILSHNGVLVGNDEIFDVELISGTFQLGEVISYGNITKSIQITVFVESGIYGENYPLRIPKNVAVIGDEFRRVIIRPASGPSSSPWAGIFFRRDTVVDSLTIGLTEFGYHYLTDPAVNPLGPARSLVDNSGSRNAAAAIIQANRAFIREQLELSADHNATLFGGHISNLINSIIFDLKYSGSARTVSAASKLRINNAPGDPDFANNAIAVIDRLAEILKFVILNNEDGSEIGINNDLPTKQVINAAFMAEHGSDRVLDALTGAAKIVVSNDNINSAKPSNAVDVFLCNDATVIRGVTCQGHRGFMAVLDPEGQILTKSPYCRDSSGFTQSTGRQQFAGGIFVDGFTGNQSFTITSKVSDTILNVSGLLRIPNTPCSVIFKGEIYRINYVRNYVYGITPPVHSTAQLVLDDSTPWPFEVEAGLINHEILTPGNRSILSNDFTQINDMGYGLVTANGGLTEAVSMFTYYCHVSYFSTSGGQIRSIGGSSSHGNFGLVAEGSDPLEIPTPTGLYHQLSQGVTIVSTTAFNQNVKGGSVLHVDYDDYLPLNGSELEINHNGSFTRYAVTTVEVDTSGPSRAKLVISAATGLEAAVAHLARATIRQNTVVVLAGDVVEVLTRPSTALMLNDSPFVYRVLEFTDYNNNNRIVDTDVIIIDSVSSGVITTNIPHRQRVGMQVRFGESLTVYNVITVGSLTTFTVTTANSIDTTEDDIVVLRRVIPHGLALAELRESYNYSIIDIHPVQPFITGSTIPGTIDSGIVTRASHGFVAGTQFRFNNDTQVDGINNIEYYWVVSAGLSPNQFRFSDTPPIQPLSGAANGLTISGITDTSLLFPGNRLVATVGNLGTNPIIAAIIDSSSILISNTANTPISGNVTFRAEGKEIDTALANPPIAVRFNRLQGAAGTEVVAITKLSAGVASRIVSSIFTIEGITYRIIAHGASDSAFDTITLDRPLVQSLISFEFPISLRSAVNVVASNTVTGKLKADGELVIKISLVRATSHDFLEIGTGSFADTNFPNDIFGLPVNDFNTTPLYSSTNEVENASSAQVQERSEGRVFFVTSDQYGNFSVGPFFKVDQGTGTVTFSAAIALSQLAGLGFKRGATISEFSVDDTMSDAANDAVPTESAVRGYIDRRLGVTHNGNVVPATSLISSGYMALNGALPMAASMNLNNNQIVNLGAPISPNNAARLSDISITNLRNTDGVALFGVNTPQAGQVAVFTDSGTISNLTIRGGDIRGPGGDVPGTTGLNLTIVPGSIRNVAISSDAAITQSKLALNFATTRDNAIGIIQADRGLASFNSAQFIATNGWVSLKSGGVALSSLEPVLPNSVLGNSTGAVTAPVSIPFSTVVDSGGAIKKSQFGLQGFIKRTATNSLTDSAFSIVNDSSANIVNTLVSRDTSGDFAGRQVTAAQLNLSVLGGTFTALRGNQLSVTSGATELFSYGLGGSSSFVGISIGDGSSNINKATNYNNLVHRFRDQTGSVTFATVNSNGLDLGTREIRAARLLNVTAISSGSSTTSGTVAGTITGHWTLTGGSRLHSTYAADLAEYYEGDAEYETGTVLIFGGTNEVTMSLTYADTRVAGVISADPAYSMYGACPGFKNQIALQGRVPCKVVGAINKGDILVTSEVPGVATAVTGLATPGTMIGKALESYNSTLVGTIEISVGRT